MMSVLPIRCEAGGVMRGADGPFEARPGPFRTVEAAPV